MGAPHRRRGGLRLTAPRRLVTVDAPEPLLVTVPDRYRHVVVLLPAASEPRYGRHGAFAQWTDLWATSFGVASVTCDLPGGGESRTRPDPDAWREQRDAALRYARELAGERPVHQFARGTGCALLTSSGGADRGDGSRVAFSPPTADQCLRVADLLSGAARTEPDDLLYVLATGDPPAADTAVAALLRWAATRL